MCEALWTCGLSLGHGREPAVLEGLDLALPAGRITALVGPNGSGKSTLLAGLAGVLRPRAGTVRRADRRDAPARLVRRLGLLAQQPAAPEGLSVAELVALGRHPHRASFAPWSACDAEAHARVTVVAALGDLADRPLEALPGGQRQRAFVGMALAQEPEVLLLDEPTTFLDVAHQIDVADILLALNRERAVKVVAALGDLGGAARLAHHTVVLHEGRVAAEGLPGAVLTPAVLERVVGVEARVFREPVSWELVVLPLGPPGRRPGAATERAS